MSLFRASSWGCANEYGAELMHLLEGLKQVPAQEMDPGERPQSRYQKRPQRKNRAKNIQKSTAKDDENIKRGLTLILSLTKVIGPKDRKLATSSNSIPLLLNQGSRNSIQRDKTERQDEIPKRNPVLCNKQKQYHPNSFLRLFPTKPYSYLN